MITFALFINQLRCIQIAQLAEPQSSRTEPGNEFEKKNMAEKLLIFFKLIFSPVVDFLLKIIENFEAWNAMNKLTEKVCAQVTKTMRK